MPCVCCCYIFTLSVQSRQSCSYPTGAQVHGNGHKCRPTCQLGYKTITQLRAIPGLLQERRALWSAAPWWPVTMCSDYIKPVWKCESSPPSDDDRWELVCVCRNGEERAAVDCEIRAFPSLFSPCLLLCFLTFLWAQTWWAGKRWLKIERKPAKLPSIWCGRQLTCLGTKLPRSTNTFKLFERINQVSVLYFSWRQIGAPCVTTILEMSHWYLFILIVLRCRVKFQMRQRWKGIVLISFLDKKK